MSVVAPAVRAQWTKFTRVSVLKKPPLGGFFVGIKRCARCVPYSRKVLESPLHKHFGCDHRPVDALICAMLEKVLPVLGPSSRLDSRNPLNGQAVLRKVE